MARGIMHTTSNGHVIPDDINHDQCVRCDESGVNAALKRCRPGIVVHVGDALSASYWGSTHYVPQPLRSGHRREHPCGACTIHRDDTLGGPTAWTPDIDGDFTAFRESLRREPAT